MKAVAAVRMAIMLNICFAPFRCFNLKECKTFVNRLFDDTGNKMEAFGQTSFALAS